MTGVIYKISFPGQTDMVYIGQTRQELKRRLQHHMFNANHLEEGKGCWKLYEYIRKYKEFLKIEILCTCDDISKLNDLEIDYIDEYHSIHPYGLNLNIGGGANTEVAEATKEKSSKSNRKLGRELNLPMYIQVSNDGTGTGFKVEYPGYKTKEFNNDNLGTQDDKLNLALLYLADAKAGNVPIKLKKSENDYPMYVMKTVYENKPCFSIEHPDYATKRIFFTVDNEDEKYAEVLIYHGTILDGTATKRRALRTDPLYSGDDMKHIQKKNAHGAIVYTPDGRSKSFARSTNTVEQNIELAKVYRNQFY